LFKDKNPSQSEEERVRVSMQEMRFGDKQLKNITIHYWVDFDKLVKLEEVLILCGLVLKLYVNNTSTPSFHGRIPLRQSFPSVLDFPFAQFLVCVEALYFISKKCSDVLFNDKNHSHTSIGFDRSLSYNCQ
jgi:hypothetical protein